MTEKNYTYWPDADHRFFLYDPEGDGFMYFKTAEERDEASDGVIQQYIDDGWSEEVEQVIAGEITHHAVMRDVEISPLREGYSCDEDYEDAIEEFGGCGDWDYKCNYKLAPISDPGEEQPTAKAAGVKS